ncbi:hypothetical protein [Micromonospora sp. NPDC005220]|uniref:hypothetical protein n=1 Tax=Micromonospora sp. NPDC005220 TaxID=3155589 RepID=UPI0033ACBD5F
MSNDVTTPDGGAPAAAPSTRRRKLWVATGVAGLTGVVGLAALGGLAARDNKSDDAQRASDSQAAPKQNVSDAGPTAGQGDGKDRDERGKDRNERGKDRDERGKDRDERGKDRDERGEDRDEHGRVREVPCDDEKLIEAIDLANRDQGGTLKLAPHCTYELSFADKKSGTGLPTIRQEITIKGNDATIKRDSEDAFRIFRVADGGDLTLKDLTVKDGNAAEFKYGGSQGPGGPQVPGAAQVPGGAQVPGAAQAADVPQAADASPAAPEKPTPPKKKDGDADGGALLVERGGSAHLVKVELTRNNAEGNGGAIANFGRVDLDDSEVENNHAQENGGGIFNVGVLKVKGSSDDKDWPSHGQGASADGKNESSHERDRESRITNNTAGDNGGGIANGRGKKEEHGKDKEKNNDYWPGVQGRDEAGSVEIFKTFIEGNTANDNGGGVFSSSGFVKIVLSTIVKNTACESGGGIYARNTNLDLEKVTVAKNHASKDGGGIANTSSEEKKKEDPSYSGDNKEQEATATITDSEIVENTAGRFGGGIFNGDPDVKLKEGFEENDGKDNKDDKNDNARLTLRDTEIKANTALNGGGIFNNKGTVTLTKTHVTKNTATDSSKKHRVAGGILNNDGKVRLDEKSTITNNDPTNCAGTVKDCFN